MAHAHRVAGSDTLHHGQRGGRKLWFLTCWLRSSVSHTTTRRRHTEPPQHARPAPLLGCREEQLGRWPSTRVPFKEREAVLAPPRDVENLMAIDLCVQGLVSPRTTVTAGRGPQWTNKLWGQRSHVPPERLGVRFSTLRAHIFKCATLYNWRH